MRVLNDMELVNARRKLGVLESLYKAKAHETGGDEELRDMTMQSLQRLMNQLKEEIARSQMNHLTPR